jgi:hypothetical protein
VSSIENTEGLVDFLASVTNETSMPGTLRVRISAGCLGVSLDHHHAIAILVREGRLASSFALARLVFESFVRGAWLAHSATDKEVEDFSVGKEPPKVDLLLSALEKNPGYAAQTLSAIKASSWRAMCSYTHTGGLQIQRWQSASSIEPTYTLTEVEEVLSFVNLFAALSATELVAFSKNEGQFERLAKSLSSYLPAAA